MYRQSGNANEQEPAGGIHLFNCAYGGINPGQRVRMELFKTLTRLR